ncbi:DNA primase, partial [Duncaniella freteri]|uniref:DNA primase n=5 Tax=Bacteroidia TaxID=200643 RepID=UPI00257474BB
TIQRVRDLDIADVLKPYVNLKRSGSSLIGSCPFHIDNKPSFSVSPVKKLYHCFSCQRGGDAISFIMDKENLTFMDAVRKIANDNNIPIEESEATGTEEGRADARHRESMLVTLDIIQKFFVESIRVNMTDESRKAVEYLNSRWSEDFYSTAGIGYAPKNGLEFMDYCRRKAIPEDTLFELGMYSRGKDGSVYTTFRQRIMIPIRNRWGRIIAYTARYIGDKANVPKYINSPTSHIYEKGETLFGIDRASRNRQSEYVIIVEGASDTLRMQSIGYDNTVAPLGTAMTDSQFEQLKKITESVCFIPDSDVADNKPYGPGFEAVMANGVTALKKGLHVTVRELPFSEVPMTEWDLSELYPDGVPSNASRMKPGKNDADSFILTPEDYLSLKEKHFIVWLGEKRFFQAGSMIEERNVVSEIANLLRYVRDQLVFDQCIEQLSKIHGKAKQWRDAVSIARNEARKRHEKLSAMDEQQRDVELLRQFGLFIRDNCYYSIGDEEEEPVRLSNFIMEPLFHIADEVNGTRLFKLRNIANETVDIELRESEMCSLTQFQQRTASLGYFMWKAKIDKLNRVKEYIYKKTDTAQRIRKLGWDSQREFFAFGNGLYDGGIFRTVDNLGIVRGADGKAYYIPATSKMHRDNDEIYQFERLMIHENRNGIKLYDFAAMLIEVYGEQARIAICYLLATLFRDIIYRQTRHFPILNLFGEKGTGKTSLATCLQSFFLHGIDPPNMSVTSIPAMNDRVSQAIDTLVVFDEYKNDLDDRKIGFLKGLWGGGGQTKKNTNTDGMAAQTIVSTGVIVCGQDKPTTDMALYTRLVYLAFSKVSFSFQEKKRYEDLISTANLGLTHLTLQLLDHRDLFSDNFRDVYSAVKKEFSAKLADEKIHDRIFDNWVIMLAAYRTLETAIELPFSYSELFETALKGVRNQNEYAKESSEVSDFW